jgi:hypothetical protein
MTCPTTIGLEQRPLANAEEFPEMLDEAWTFADLTGVGLYDELVIDGGPLRSGFEAFTTDALLLFDSAGESLNATDDCIDFDGGWVAASAAPQALPGGLLFFINTKTLALSSATLPAVTVLGDGETLYVATPTGLSVLAGDIESGADPHVKTGKMALSPGMTCNVPRAYPRIQTDGDLELVTVADVRERQASGEVVLVERVSTMAVPGRTGAHPQERTVNLPRGTETESWAFILKSKTGAAEAWAVSALRVRTDRERKVR